MRRILSPTKCVVSLPGKGQTCTRHCFHLLTSMFDFSRLRGNQYHDRKNSCTLSRGRIANGNRVQHQKTRYPQDLNYVFWGFPLTPTSAFLPRPPPPPPPELTAAGEEAEASLKAVLGALQRFKRQEAGDIQSLQQDRDSATLLLAVVDSSRGVEVLICFSWVNQLHSSPSYSSTGSQVGIMLTQE